MPISDWTSITIDGVEYQTTGTVTVKRDPEQIERATLRVWPPASGTLTMSVRLDDREGREFLRFLDRLNPWRYWRIGKHRAAYVDMRRATWTRRWTRVRHLPRLTRRSRP